jgi:signal transduction histidine kinase/HPt (histidine-containing phosphotransfer) domain-containing protein
MPVFFLFFLISLFLIPKPLHAQTPVPEDSRWIRSASETDYPPYCILNEKGEADGFSVALLRAALQSMGFEVSFETGTWIHVKQSLINGQVQVLPLVGRTPEREALFDFTFPYLRMHGTLVVREGEQDIRTLEDLEGKTVSVMRGDNAEEFLRRSHPKVHIRATATFEEALRQVEEGLSDAVVIQKLLALQLMEQMGSPRLKTTGPPLKDFVQSFCFAVAKGDEKLLALLNEGLSIVMADGTFRTLHARWFGPLADLERGRSHIIVGGDSHFPPYEFLDEKGQPTGYNVELSQAIARTMGIPLEIRLMPWHKTREALRLGEIDAVHSMFYSKEREKDFLFTPAHIRISYVLVSKDKTLAETLGSMEDLEGKTLVVHKGDIMHDLALAQGYKDRLILASDQEEALRLVAEGPFEHALVARIPALYWIAAHGWDHLHVSQQPLLSPEYCYAVNPGREALLSQLAEGLSIVKSSGEYRGIQARWFGVYESMDVKSMAIFRYLLISASLMALLILAFVISSRILRQKIREKTFALSQEIQERKQAQNKLLEAKEEAERLNVSLEKKRLEAETLAQEAQAQAGRAELARIAKDEFLANMGHELRTPMNGLMGMFTLLLETPLNETQLRYVTQGLARSQSLLGLLNAILDFSQVQEGRLNLNRMAFSPHEMLKKLCATLDPLARNKGLILKTCIPPDIPSMVCGDPSRLEQILFILLDNAFKFTHKGQICIRVEMLSETPGQVLLRFSVKDTGIGIPSEKKDALFQHFSQVDSSSTRAYGGAGLGLALARTLTEHMGGSMGFESRENTGSEFWFTASFQRQADMTVLDKKAMMTRFMDDEALASQVVQVFLSDIPTQIALLRTYLDQGNTDLARRQAHTIKGASANVGGVALASLAAVMEKEGDQNNLPGMQIRMKEMEAAFEILQNTLKTAFNIKDLP